LAEASHDHYLNLLLGEAIRSGKTVRSEHMPWTNYEKNVKTGL